MGCSIRPAMFQKAPLPVAYDDLVELSWTLYQSVRNFDGTPTIPTSEFRNGEKLAMS